MITEYSAGGFQLQELPDRCFHHVLNLEFFSSMFIVTVNAVFTGDVLV